MLKLQSVLRPRNSASLPLHFSISALQHLPPMPSPKPSPSQKLRIASMLYATARKVKLAALKRVHPDWTETKLVHELNRRFFLLHD